MADRRLLLLAHGSRRSEWSRPFEAALEQVRRARPDRSVALAYLESTAPLLDDALDAAARDGCVDVCIVPLLLGAGGHLRRDIPDAVARAAERHPGMRVRIASAAGDDAGVIAALAAYAAAQDAERP